MQCATIWTLKATLLIMYFRVTKQLPQHLYVKLLMVYVGVTFVVMEILYFAVWCHPFHDYWAVPTPNKQCDTAIDHLITNAVFNLTSDVAMLIIGFSLAAKSKLPWKRRILMHGIFALGIFVVRERVSHILRQMMADQRADCGSRAQQVLFLLEPLRISLDVLVHPRSFDRHDCREPAVHVDIDPACVQRGFFHWRVRLRDQISLFTNLTIPSQSQET